jgi:hypothetical protein
MGYFWTAHMGHLWKISKKNWQRYKFYTFPISFKKEIVFASWPNEFILPFLIAMATLILIFLFNEITFCFSCGISYKFFVDFCSVFWEFINGFLKVFWGWFDSFLWVLWEFNEGFLRFFLWWCHIAYTKLAVYFWNLGVSKWNLAIMQQNLAIIYQFLTGFLNLFFDFFLLILSFFLKFEGFLRVLRGFYKGFLWWFAMVSSSGI